MDKKGMFSRVIVVFCVAFMVLLTIASLAILFFTGYDPSSIFGVAAGFFGGELMMLCAKRIFAKPSTPTDNNNTDSMDVSSDNDDDAVGGK